MKFNLIYYILLSLFYIWSLFIPKLQQFDQPFEEVEFDNNVTYAINYGKKNIIIMNIKILLHYAIFLLLNIFLEHILVILMDESNRSAKQLFKEHVEDILISIHRDYALDGVAGVFFNRYSVKIMCFAVRMITIFLCDNQYLLIITIFSIFYDMSRACRWRIMPNYDFEEPYSERTPYFVEAVLDQDIPDDELSEDLKRAKQLEIENMNEQLNVTINGIKRKINELKTFLFNAIGAANGVNFPAGLDVDVNPLLHIRLEPGQVLVGDQDKAIKDEMSKLSRELEDLNTRQSDLHMKWLEEKVYQARNYTKVRIEKMEDLEKHAEGYDHFVYTKTQGRITFTSKVWKKFEDGLYEFSRDESYKIVQVTTDSKFVNKLCIQANALLQKLIITPPKIVSNTWFDVTEREKYILTRCYYAQRMYNMLTAFCQSNIKFIEVMKPEEFEALISFACSHAFGNRGLGRFEQWMNLNNKEYLDSMGFQFQN